MNSGIRRAIILWVMAVGLALPAAMAQTPYLLNYQGRVAVGGTNFDGTGTFRFALMNGGGAFAYWSNGVGAVTSPVSKGLYSILLGDTNLANMAALSPVVFTNTDMRLRVWFAPLGDSLQQLSPDQRIAAAGYAISAANAVQFDGRSASAFALIGSSPSFSGTVTAAGFTGNGAGITNVSADRLGGQPAGAFAASNHHHDAIYVNTGEVNSVTSAMVVNGAIAAADLASDAASLEKTAAGIMGVRGSGIGIGNGCVAGPLFQVRGQGLVAMGIQNTTYHFDEVCGGSIWQSFSNSGSATTLAAVDVRFDTASASGTLNIYSGNGAGGTLLYSQPVIMLASSGGQWQRFALTTPLALSAGTQYTFAFSAGVNRIYESLNTYGGGQTWMADRDLQFILYATASSTNQVGLVVNPSLNVGIGLAAPSTELEVAGTVKAEAFIGNGAGLTNLNAATMTGTLTTVQLPAGLLTNNATGVTLTGSFAGNGVGMTNMNLLNVNSQGALGWATNSGVFASVSNLPVGAAPLWLVAGAINGDTKPDLACVNYTDNTVMVLTNNGSGVFKISATITVGAGPSGIAAADVNGDGRLDLVTANDTANTLSVLTNNGSGGLTVSSSPAVGRGPNSVIAVDVNNDSRIDLVSANYLTNTLTVLTNNGSGVFTLFRTLLVGNTPWTVVSADLNGDSKPDLVSANIGSQTLSVLTNNGSGIFSTLSTLAAPNLNGVAVVDVNGDSRRDLVYSASVTNAVCVLTNNGAAAFTQTGMYAVGPGPGAIAAGDLNGDGKQDLVVCNHSGSTLSVLTNNGAGAFASPGTLAVGAAPFCVIAYDLNVDGLNDVACVNQSSDTLSVALNNASYETTFSGSFSGNGADLTQLEAADIIGTLSDARLSTNVAFLAGPQVFSGSNRFAGVVTATNAANIFAGNFTGSFTGSFAGNGAGITNVNAGQLDGQHGAFYQNAANLNAGTLSAGRLPATVVTNGEAGLALSGTFSGNGAGLTNVNAEQLDGQPGAFYQNAANLASGTIPDARLSPNVVLETSSPVFTSTVTAARFSGNGGSLTNINADRVDGQHGAFYQNASNLTAGTVGDMRLSTNVALRNAGQTFSGTNTFTAANTFTATNRFTGLIRSGSETGTDEAPNPAGLVIRRINSSVMTTGSVVAAVRAHGTNEITLERDGTPGGWRFRFPASITGASFSAMGSDVAGTSRNQHYALADGAAARIQALYLDGHDMVYFQVNFGITGVAGGHQAQVTLSRYNQNATNWVGTVISTWNQ